VPRPGEVKLRKANHDADYEAALAAAQATATIQLQNTISHAAKERAEIKQRKEPIRTTGTVASRAAR